MIQIGKSSENGDFLKESTQEIREINIYVTHRIHGAGIYANIGGILMVNVPIYSIHGSYGLMCFVWDNHFEVGISIINQDLNQQQMQLEVTGR